MSKLYYKKEVIEVELPQSKITTKQCKQVKKESGKDIYLLNIRYDDNCGNKHNTFSITLDHYRNIISEKTLVSFGCQHKLVASVFTEYEKYIQWHLTSSDGPMHYLENTIYHIQEGNIAAAIESAVWPEGEKIFIKAHENMAKVNDYQQSLLKDIEPATSPLEIITILKENVDNEIYPYLDSTVKRKRAYAMIELIEALEKDNFTTFVTLTKKAIEVFANQQKDEIGKVVANVLVERLSNLMVRFKADMEELAFEY